MKRNALSRILTVCLSAGLVLAAAACSSDDSNGTAPGGGSCDLAPGEYTMTTTKDPSSSATCPEGTTTTITVAEKTDASSDADAGSQCKVELDSATCTGKTTCHVEQNGIVIDTEITSTVGTDGKSYTGTQSQTMVANGTTTSCKYTTKAEKK